MPGSWALIDIRIQRIPAIDLPCGVFTPIAIIRGNGEGPVSVAWLRL